MKRPIPDTTDRALALAASAGVPVYDDPEDPKIVFFVVDGVSPTILAYWGIDPSDVPSGFDPFVLHYLAIETERYPLPDRSVVSGPALVLAIETLVDEDTADAVDHLACLVETGGFRPTANLANIADQFRR